MDCKFGTGALRASIGFVRVGTPDVLSDFAALILWPNQALQRTRRERRGCNHGVPWAGSLSLVR